MQLCPHRRNYLIAIEMKSSSSVRSLNIEYVITTFILRCLYCLVVVVYEHLVSSVHLVKWSCSIVKPGFRLQKMSISGQTGNCGCSVVVTTVLQEFPLCARRI